MLELCPGCECCDVDLPPDSPDARICSFECTFCAKCAEDTLRGRCPNCGGELVTLGRGGLPRARAESAFGDAGVQTARMRGRISKIEHVALWTEDIERLAGFYQRYFGAAVADKYVNATKGFESRFVSFEAGARLEIMRTTTLAPVKYEPGAQRMGLTHFAVSLGSEQRVDELTKRLRDDGHTILDAVRAVRATGTTKSVVLDPDGNRVEIVAEHRRA